jgi:hypothetical protein
LVLDLQDSGKFSRSGTKFLPTLQSTIHAVHHTMDKTPKAGAQANVHEIPVRLGKRHESPRSPTEIAENLRRVCVAISTMIDDGNANL